MERGRGNIVARPRHADPGAIKKLTSTETQS